MGTYLRRAVMAVALVLACSVSLALRAQTSDNSANPPGSADLSKRVEDLEKEVERLQTELAAMKNGTTQAAPSASTQAPAASAAAAPPAVSPGAPAAPPSQTSATPSASTPAEVQAAPVAAPPTSSPFDSISINGIVDGYYSYNFEHPQGAVASVPAGNTGNELTGFRAFDAPTQALTLNMLELTIAKAPDANNSRLGFDLTLGYGNAMNVVNSAEPGGLGFAQYLKEAYVSYLAPVGKGMQIDFGKFVTPFGAEVIETNGNWNYSRGILFTYAIPFYHFGLRSKYAFNDKYSLTGFLVNGWNDVVDNNTGKTGGFSFGWNPTKKVSVTQTYMAGPEEANNNSNVRQLWDTVVNYNPTSRLSLMWNYDYGRGDRILNVANPVWWSGIAGYVRYAFTSNYALAARYEFYDDHYGFTTGTPQDLNEFTATFERTVAKHLISRIEFRRDMSNQPSLLKGSTPVKDQNTLAAGLVYVFDIHEGH